MLDKEAKRIVDMIKKAAETAAERGVEVSLELHASGFFPGERIDLTVTAKPTSGKK